MLAALAGAGIKPDLVLGTSIGGINGAFVAAHPVSGVTQLGQLWQQDSTGTLLGDGLVSQLRTLRRTLISLHSNDQLESLLSVALEASTHIEDRPPLRVCRLMHRDRQRHLVRARTPRPGVARLRRRPRALRTGGHRGTQLHRRWPGRFDPACPGCAANIATAGRRIGPASAMRSGRTSAAAPRVMVAL